MAGFDPLAELSSSAPQDLHKGLIVHGLVVQIDDAYVWVDVDSKSEGRVPREEFASLPKEGETIIVRYERSEEGIPLFSHKLAAIETLRHDLKRAFAEGTVMRGKVVREAKGGMRVDFGGIEGYAPMRLLDIRSAQSPEHYIGQEFDFKVIEFSQGQRGRNSLSIVVSRRELLETQREEKIGEIFEQHKVGDVVEGVVRNITKNGVFVDIGGFDGLIRFDDLTWKRGANSREIVHPNDTLRVKIVQMDSATKRVGLSLKDMTENPFDQFCQDLHPGDELAGKVVKLENFGAFVRLADGVEGLLHISELSWTKRVAHPKEILSVGSEIQVKILAIDYKEKRLSLSFRQLHQNPYDSLEKDYAVNSRHTGRISRVADPGVFVELPSGIEGLVRKEDISWARGDLASSFVPGDMVEVRILGVDAKKKKISLGIKQLQDNPIEVFAFNHPIGSRLEGKVTRVADFGAFVDLGAGLEGLIHISNLSDKRVDKVSDAVKPGDMVEVKVIEIDAARNTIGLTMKNVDLESVNASREEASGTFRLGNLFDLSGFSER
ncbi:MAG: S1 RNA-binding domain-containing protein [Spirochaetota bacterium]|jgi:small subunit ribosomal protein S1|nr:S1 RNA-binding domain-containing protein [Spirochaetota bacterium]